MKTTIKGLTFNVNVSVSAKADDYHESNGKTYNKEDTRNSNIGIKNLDISANCYIDTGFDSFEGEVELPELVESIKLIVDDSIKNQIQEQIDEAKSYYNDKFNQACSDLKEEMSDKFNEAQDDLYNDMVTEIKKATKHDRVKNPDFK